MLDMSELNISDNEGNVLRTICWRCEDAGGEGFVSVDDLPNLLHADVATASLTSNELDRCVSMLADRGLLIIDRVAGAVWVPQEVIWKFC